MAAATTAPNSFLLRNREKADFNQYWYSQPTIAEFAAEVQAHVGAGGRCAFLSTPSIFFSLDDEAVKAASVLFDVRTNAAFTLDFASSKHGFPSSSNATV